MKRPFPPLTQDNMPRQQRVLSEHLRLQENLDRLVACMLQIEEDEAALAQMDRRLTASLAALGGVLAQLNGAMTLIDDALHAADPKPDHGPKSQGPLVARL